MRARFIYEKFIQQDSDPITDMNIGRNKKTILAKVNSLKGTVSEDEIFDFIEALAHDAEDNTDVNCAVFDVYMPFNMKEKLFFLYKILGKRKIKIKEVDVDDYSCDHEIPESVEDPDEWLYNKKIQPLLNKGWEIFYEEYGGNSPLYILINYS